MKGLPLLLLSTTVGLTVLGLEWSVAMATTAIAATAGAGPSAFDIGNLTGNAALVAIFWWYISKIVPKREEQSAVTIRELTQAFRDEAKEERDLHRESIDKMCAAHGEQMKQLIAAIKGQ